MQQRLTEFGLYKGSIEGSFGPGTKKAIEAFQTQQQIPVTGIPDRQMLLRLMYLAPGSKPQ